MKVRFNTATKYASPRVWEDHLEVSQRDVEDGTIFEIKADMGEVLVEQGFCELVELSGSAKKGSKRRRRKDGDESSDGGERGDGGDGDDPANTDESTTESGSDRLLE